MAHHDNVTFEQTVQRVCHVAQDFLPKVTSRTGTGYRMYSIYSLQRALIRIADPLTTDPDTAERLLQRVLHNCPPMCAWMVAVVYGRVGSLYRLANNVLNEAMGMDFFEDAVMYLTRRGKWSSLSSIFDHRPHRHLVLSCKTLLCNLSHYGNIIGPAAVELFTKIVYYADIWDPELLAKLVLDVMREGLVEQFEVLVNSPRPAVRKEVAANLKSLMATVCTRRMKYGADSKRSGRFDDSFIAAAKAGLFAATDPTTGTECMAMAAVANQPDLVLCLHHCGTLGSRDFSAMLGRNDVKAIGSKDPARVWGIPSCFYTVPFDDEAMQTAFGIKSFLAKQASTPSSLKKMCLQHLSKQAGWGNGREERIREMDILDSLKDDLRFKGLENVLIKKNECVWWML